MAHHYGATILVVTGTTSFSVQLYQVSRDSVMTMCWLTLIESTVHSDGSHCCTVNFTGGFNMFVVVCVLCVFVLGLHKDFVRFRHEDAYSIDCFGSCVDI